MTIEPLVLTDLGRTDCWLTELLTPEEIYIESAALNSTMAAEIDYIALYSAGSDLRTESLWLQTDAVTALREGQRRFFALRENDTSLAMIVYDVRRQAIDKIHTFRDRFEGQWFHAPLIKAIGQLRQTIPLARLDALWNRHNMLLMDDGTSLAIRGQDLDTVPFAHILIGSFDLKPSIPQAFLEKAAASACFNFHITSSEGLERLPDCTRARLYYTGEKFDVQHFRELGDLRLDGQHTISLTLPHLRKIGDLEASQAVRLILPSLEESGNLSFKGTKGIDLSRLRKAANLRATGLPDLAFDALEEVRDLFLWEAEKVSLKRLKKALCVRLFHTKRVFLPALESVDQLILPETEDVDLPALRVAHTLEIKRAKRTSLPALLLTQKLKIDDLEALRAPALLSVETLDTAKTFGRPSTLPSVKAYFNRLLRLPPALERDVSLKTQATDLKLAFYRYYPAYDEKDPFQPIQTYHYVIDTDQKTYEQTAQELRADAPMLRDSFKALRKVYIGAVLDKRLAPEEKRILKDIWADVAKETLRGKKISLLLTAVKDEDFVYQSQIVTRAIDDSLLQKWAAHYSWQANFANKIRPEAQGVFKPFIDALYEHATRAKTMREKIPDPAFAKYM